MGLFMDEERWRRCADVKTGRGDEVERRRKWALTIPIRSGVGNRIQPPSRELRVRAEIARVRELTVDCLRRAATLSPLFHTADFLWPTPSPPPNALVRP